MAHEYNKVTNKIQPNQAPNGKGMSAPAGTNAKVIPAYKSAGHWNLFNPPSRVKEFQERFRMDKSPLPVFLRRGQGDLLMYRGAMTITLVGIAIAFTSIYKMATGKITKKETS